MTWGVGEVIGRCSERSTDGRKTVVASGLTVYKLLGGRALPESVELRVDRQRRQRGGEKNDGQRPGLACCKQNEIRERRGEGGGTDQVKREEVMERRAVQLDQMAGTAAPTAWQPSSQGRRTWSRRVPSFPGLGCDCWQRIWPCTNIRRPAMAQRASVICTVHDRRPRRRPSSRPCPPTLLPTWPTTPPPSPGALSSSHGS